MFLPSSLTKPAANRAERCANRGMGYVADVWRRRRVTVRPGGGDEQSVPDERARKRGELLAATEKELDTIAAATRRQRRPLRGKDKIALRVGKARDHYKMAKHIDLQITDDSITFTRKDDQIAAEAALDGIYVLRTSLPAHGETTRTESP